jgi:hypothetical protein
MPPHFPTEQMLSRWALPPFEIGNPLMAVIPELPEILHRISPIAGCRGYLLFQTPTLPRNSESAYRLRVAAPIVPSSGSEKKHCGRSRKRLIVW